MPSHRLSLMQDSGVIFGVQIPLWQVLGPHWPSGSQSVSVPHGMHGSVPPVEQRGPGRQRSARQEPPGALFPAPSSHSSPQSRIPFPHSSFLHVGEQPSQPVTLKSSQSSPGSTVPLPHRSWRHWWVQPSPSTVLPSSHSSVAASVPSPQPGGTRRRQSAEQPPTFGVSHSSRHSTVPLPQFSIWQVDEQPSHAVVLPSSQVSAASMWRSPHTLSRREQSP